MNSSGKYLWPPVLKIVVLAFLVVFIAVAFYLFYPVMQCVREWGGFSADCKQTLELTLYIPFTLFVVVWILFIAVAILTMRRNK
ncbi:hypothetical protein KDX05_26485 [Burkholderia vietnamiensis]|nr:hypothetical protein [Burkholderia vietnamiensis]MBR8150581.1 hypothetical protein [Burkholderia vietnamiensis]MBR8231852.1 hypothetical protein [Burkholderia vietnamiensis]MCA7947491.1 hypothetical protein [Burkholderia vietnamiensis]HDR8973620.1 hypothetical protein [Burkholderia vietnamiensis]HDR9145979.1 hypothetical protein [Burkholderia vietnamiensis]